MARATNNLIIDMNWKQAIDSLSNDDAGRLLKQLLQYNLTGEYTKQNQFVDLMFTMMKPFVDANQYAYNRKLAVFNYAKYLQSKRWKAVSKQVMDKYGYKCVDCGSVIKLNVHHLTYKHIGKEEDHLDDLTLLCNKCHKQVHGIGDEL